MPRYNPDGTVRSFKYEDDNPRKPFLEDKKGNGNRVSAEDTHRSSLIAAIKRLEKKKDDLHSEIKALQATRKQLQQEVNQLRDL